ncbi:MAG: hypothetical protein ACAI44_20415 [Candidatus Sericytochromatia bacterium]
MLKRIAAFFVLLTVVFAFQGNVWAATVNAEDTMAKQQTEVIALAENPQLAALNEDIQLLGATGFGGMKIEPWFWVLSIPIAGLGQFLMGDIVRGIMFFLAPVLIGIIGAVLTTLFVTGAVGSGNVGLATTLGPIIGLAIPLLILGIWIWNVVDAYFMNQEKVGMSSIDPMQKAAELHEQLTRVAEFMQKNQIVAAEGGLGVNSQLVSF